MGAFGIVGHKFVEKKVASSAHWKLTRRFSTGPLGQEEFPFRIASLSSVQHMTKEGLSLSLFLSFFLSGFCVNVRTDGQECKRSNAADKIAHGIGTRKGVAIIYIYIYIYCHAYVCVCFSR